LCLCHAAAKRKSACCACPPAVRCEQPHTKTVLEKRLEVSPERGQRNMKLLLRSSGMLGIKTDQVYTWGDQRYGFSAIYLRVEFEPEPAITCEWFSNKLLYAALPTQILRTNQKGTMKQCRVAVDAFYYFEKIGRYILPDRKYSA
jgi:hypothetical protein